MDATKYLAVTKHEAELLLDSVKVSSSLTRDIALKAASIVLEFAADAGVEPAAELTNAGNRVSSDVR